MRTFLCIAVLVTASCGESPASKPSVSIPPPPAWVMAGETAPYLARFVGETKLAILRGADRVESFRIDSHLRLNDPGTINGYPVIEKGPTLDTKQSAQARRLVTRLESVFPMGKKACGFSPGVALRFHRGDEHVTVVICFQCREWLLALGDEPERALRPQWGFEGAHIELLQLVRALFPDDADIRAIAPHNRYSIAYQVPAALPSSEDDIRADFELGSTAVLAKYLPEAASKVKNWDEDGGLGDSALSMDGLFFVLTTKENHEIISRLSGVRAVEYPGK